MRAGLNEMMTAPTTERRYIGSTRMGSVRGYHSAVLCHLGDTDRHRCVA